VPLVFLTTWSFLKYGPNAAGILILVGWLGTLRQRTDWAGLVLSRRAIAISVGFFAWLALTAIWATSAGEVFVQVWLFYVGGLTALVIMTTFSTARSMQQLLTMFVVGAVLAVVVALGTSGFSSAAADPNSLHEGRLATGSGDPNVLAAGLVPAIMIAAGLFAAVRSPLKRWPLIAAIAILAFGLAKTESRGGLVAMIVALIAAAIVFKKHRAKVVITLAVAASLFATFLAITPGAWHRVTSLRDSGAGRTDLWHVAWRISEDHPIVGVGLNNFRTVSRDYVRRPGNLKNVRLVVDEPHLVHNLYLQLLAETGVIGLGLFLCLAGGSLAAARRAALNFDIRGESTLATLSRCVLVATIGMLAAAFFLSAGNDYRQWILLGIGPAMLGLSRRAAPAVEQ